LPGERATYSGKVDGTPVGGALAAPRPIPIADAFGQWT
jgi:hypothetical protein